MKIKLTKRAFTLVELLAVIVILGILMTIGITAVSNLISKAKQTQFEQQEKNISMAAESYGQANKSVLPKQIGEAVNVKVSTLKDSSYLKEDIENSNGESCMNNSYVRIYKISKTEYSYVPYLYCGDDKVPDVVEVPQPTIKIKFTDGSSNSSNKFDNVSNAYLNMTLTGGKTSAGYDIAIDGYSFSISTKSNVNDEYVEVYNSGTLSANNENTINIKKKLSDYVSLRGATYVSVKVIVRNVTGGLKEITSTLQDSNSEAYYNDTENPECGRIDYQATGDDDWINKDGIESGISRTISVGCSDGGGSGCLRGTFTSTWPKNSQKNAEYSYITIKDNNDNTTNCRVRVNVDSVAPTINVNAYKATSNGGTTGSNVLSSTFKAADGAEGKIVSTDYKNNYDGWLNNSEYPYGVIYSIDTTDNLHLYKWTWETNAGYINDNNSSDFKNVSVDNADGASGYFANTDLNSNDNGTTKGTFNISFSTEGMRFGVLTIYDRAGNSTKFYIYANIDRTAPPVPTIASVKTDKKNYTSGTWTNQAVTIVLDENVSRADNLSTGGTTISGWSKFVYEVKKHGETTASITGNDSSYIFNNTSSFEGKNQIVWKSCDKANNCSNYTNVINVYIDVTKPTCSVTALKDGTSTYNSGWVNAGHYVLVKATCSDSRNSVSDKNSGCVNTTDKPSSFSYEYRTNINTTVAGAKGNNQGGRVYDNAGNYEDCSANKTVKVDVEAPKCTSSGDNSKWTNKSVTIKWSCSESASGMSSTQSGCNSSYSGDSKTFNESNSFTKTYQSPKYEIRDNAGNVTTCEAKTHNVYYDTIAPECTKTGDNKTWTNSNVTITWGCSDSNSGCNSSYSGGSKTFTTTTKTWDASKYTIKDNAGNSTTCEAKTRNIYLDKTKPTCTSSGDNKTWTKNSVTITYGCSDSDSGCKTANKTQKFTTTTKTWTNGAYTIEDNAGNSKECAAKTHNIYVDTTPPTVNSCTTQKSSISGLSVTDNDSGYNSSATKYAFKENSSSAPGATSSSWGSNSGTTSCGKSNINGFVKVQDKAGNVTIAHCSGSYNTDSCCSESNPYGCTWVTSCRSGNTFIYTSSAHTTYAGTVSHSLSGGTNDKLYVLGTSGRMTYVYAESGVFYSAANGSHYVWIYSNCIGGSNSICPYSQCPG